MIDLLLINPGNSKGIYQDLSNKYSAVEPPTWALLLAKSCLSKNYKVEILDCNAELLDNSSALKEIKKVNPKLICFVVYGQNVNSGTTNMSGAISLLNFLKNNKIDIPIAFIGSHVQALPVETLKKEKNIDFVFTNEGVYALWNVLALKKITKENLSNIKGIAFQHKNKVIFNEPEKIVPNERMDIDLPGYAWELLPYKKSPLDLYRSPMWHAEYVEENRSPYAAIQTSLGCQFKCSFCMINIINRNNKDEIGDASQYSKMRHWSPNFIIKEFKKLISLGVKTIKITDEMFLLNPKYYIPLCEMLSEINKDDSLRLWAYSRIDTVKRPEILKMVREAGIKWLALGIESGDKNIRLEVSKGKFEDVDVKKIVKQIHDSDIEIMANYIFGLPGDNHESMKKTFELSKELCTSGWNTYAAMALPGSRLYKLAIEKNFKLPENYEGFSFHSYNTQPLPTEYLKPYEILRYRDECYINYHTDKKFIQRISSKYGKNAANNILEMSKIKLKRKIIEEAEKNL
jgi:anaerobic magnesium-protoporphyrin IX monomethyl ester cyclase